MALRCPEAVPVIRSRTVFRKEALIHSVQPEAYDDLLRVTAPRERIFRAMLLGLLLGLVAWAVLAV